MLKGYQHNGGNKQKASRRIMEILVRVIRIWDEAITSIGVNINNVDETLPSSAAAKAPTHDTELFTKGAHI